MVKRGIIFLLIILYSKLVMADIIINEIMYNPNQCSYRYCEWIELYNNGNYSINLYGWNLTDNEATDTIECCNFFQNCSFVLPSEGYALITDQDTWLYNLSISISNETLKLCVDDNSIGNGLGDTQDTINITNGTYNDIISYLDDWGADGDNYTLERINPNETNSQENWGASLVAGGTPGYQNSIYGTGGINYSQIEVTEFLPDPEGDDNAPMPNGEWIELYNPTNSAIDLKWLFFEDLYGHSLYITDTTVSTATIIPANGYLVVYTNGRSGFLNNDGSEVLVFYDKLGNNIKNISYNGAAEGNSYAYVEGIGWQHTKPTPGEENVDYNNVKDSQFNIESVLDLGPDKKARFGQTIRVKAIIYKGNTTKNSIKLYIKNDDNERVSKETKTNVYTRFTNYTLTLPIQIKPNCDEDYGDGNYTIYIEGLDKTATKDVQIEDISKDMCEIVKESGETDTKTRIEYLVIDAPEYIELENEFEVKARIVNNDNKAHEFSVWSYVYRGSKSYSGDREKNKRKIALSKKETRDIILKNTVRYAEPGNNYKLKVKIKKDELKTNKEITRNIIIKDIIKKEIEKENPAPLSLKEDDEVSGEIIKEDRVMNVSALTSFVAYEAENYKINKIIIYSILGLTVLLNIILILRR